MRQKFIQVSTSTIGESAKNNFSGVREPFAISAYLILAIK